MGGRAILVVDDEKNIRLTLAQALEALGGPVTTAADGDEALAALAATEYEVVLLDLRMPGMDGMEVLRRVREQWPRTRVVIITAHGTVASAVEALKLGAVDFIQKPFGPAEVRELVQQVIDREGLSESEAVDYPGLIQLAKRSITERRFGEADEFIRRAIACEPSQAEAYNLLGALLESQGDQLEGLKFYRAALDIDPTYAPARANLERASSWPATGKIRLGDGSD